MIHIPDEASDRCLFNIPVQAIGVDRLKMALVLISEKLTALDARIFQKRYLEPMSSSLISFSPEPFQSSLTYYQLLAPLENSHSEIICAVFIGQKSLAVLF